MTPNEPTNDPAREEVMLGVRLPIGVRDALRAEAAVHHRTLSGQVRWLIEQALSRDDESRAA